MDKILDEIRAERTRQDSQWGGRFHDDTEDANDWAAYIVNFIGKSIQWPLNLTTFRSNMVKVAALAVASVEWADRKIDALNKSKL